MAPLSLVVVVLSYLIVPISSHPSKRERDPFSLSDGSPDLIPYILFWRMLVLFKSLSPGQARMERREYRYLEGTLCFGGKGETQRSDATVKNTREWCGVPIWMRRNGWVNWTHAWAFPPSTPSLSPATSWKCPDHEFTKIFHYEWNTRKRRSDWNT